jgi:simple sugar transport system ATP-binding protein
MIRMQAMRKVYGSVAAVDGVDFDLDAGEIHALLGENGAGKSTLTKMLSGVVQPSSGTILLDGSPVHFGNPAEAMAAGIAMVYQENSLVPTMTVAQNLFLGEERAFNRLRPLYIAAQQFLQSLNFNVDPWAQVSTLARRTAQMVEIARAVRKNARVIIFDEPTASLTPEEKHHFFGLVRRLKANGVSIVFISHALEEALDLSDRITVLRDGRLVATGPTATFDRARIVSAMVGAKRRWSKRRRVCAIRARPGAAC